MQGIALALLAYDAKRKPTHRKKSLAGMTQVVPWAAPLAVTEPCYPYPGRRGRPPMPLVADMARWSG